MTSRMRLVPLWFVAASVGCAASQPAMLGVANGKLAACPSAPHCVSSQAEGRHAIEPAKFTGSRDEASRKLGEIMRGMPGARIITETPDYLRAEFSSRVFHYVDDVEIYVDGRSKLVQFRSSSRNGYFDFGANRGRIEGIRKKFLAAEAAAKS